MIKTPAELYTAGKLAKMYGVTPSEIKQAIKVSKVKPDTIKGGCSYYTSSTAEKIKSALKK